MTNSSESGSKTPWRRWLELAHSWSALAAQCLVTSEACRRRSLEEYRKSSNGRRPTLPNSGESGRRVRVIGPVIVIKAPKRERSNGHKH